MKDFPTVDKTKGLVNKKDNTVVPSLDSIADSLNVRHPSQYKKVDFDRDDVSGFYPGYRFEIRLFYSKEIIRIVNNSRNIRMDIEDDKINKCLILKCSLHCEFEYIRYYRTDYEMATIKLNILAYTSSAICYHFFRYACLKFNFGFYVEKQHTANSSYMDLYSQCMNFGSMIIPLERCNSELLLEYKNNASIKEKKTESNSCVMKIRLNYHSIIQSTIDCVPLIDAKVCIYRKNKVYQECNTNDDGIILIRVPKDLNHNEKWHLKIQSMGQRYKVKESGRYYPYYVDEPLNMNVSYQENIIYEQNIYVDVDSTTSRRALFVGQALAFGTKFVKEMTGKELKDFVYCIFPHTCPDAQNSVSHANTKNIFYLEEHRYVDWTTVLHEFTHLLQMANNTCRSGGAHDFYLDATISRPNSSRCMKMPFTEAWATANAINILDYYKKYLKYSLQSFYRTKTYFFTKTLGSYANLQGVTFIEPCIFSECTEGDIVTFMLDITLGPHEKTKYGNDVLSQKEFYNAMLSSKATSLYEFVQYLENKTSLSKEYLGYLCEKYGFACRAPQTLFSQDDFVLSWTRGGSSIYQKQPLNNEIYEGNVQTVQNKFEITLKTPMNDKILEPMYLEKDAGHHVYNKQDEASILTAFGDFFYFFIRSGCKRHYVNSWGYISQNNKINKPDIKIKDMYCIYLSNITKHSEKDVQFIAGQYTYTTKNDISVQMNYMTYNKEYAMYQLDKKDESYLGLLVNCNKMVSIKYLVLGDKLKSYKDVLIVQKYNKETNMLETTNTVLQFTKDCVNNRPATLIILKEISDHCIIRINPDIREDIQVLIGGLCFSK